MNSFDEVNNFWFGDIVNELSLPSQNQLWYQAEKAQDELIKQLFLPLYLQATNNQLAQWQSEPKGMLALVILLDQMPRNMFRGTKQAFGSDELALTLAKKGVTLGIDKQLTLIERVFFYHPFEHSEQLVDQQQSVTLFEQLLTEYNAPEHIGLIENSLHWAKVHYEIIEQFGRFPHRNEILGRQSTAQELEFLEQGPNFGQSAK